MTRPLTALAGAAALLALLVPARPAAAQGRTALNVGAGFARLEAPGQTYPLGVVIDASGRLFLGLRWVGEFSWSRQSEDDGEGASASLTATGFAAGARWALNSRIRPYAQVLVGQHRDRYVFSAEGAGRLVDFSQDARMWQPGAGLSVPFPWGWRAFGQADWRRVMYDDQPENDVRIVVGARLAIR